MAEFEVFLEVGAEGVCMAHVLDLPGCFVAAAGKEQALERLPEAIRAYYGDLIHHGEPVTMPAQIMLTVVEEQTLSGPFHPGDRAALFGPDRRPLERAEIDSYLGLAAHNRADLLALVRGLSDTILDWRPEPGAMNIRRILSHIGRGELWYSTRVMEPDGPPRDWEAMPLRQFLNTVRDAVSVKFRELSDEQLVAVTYPPRSDGDADEPWTARKALRRMLEHEREHTSHIEEILAAWRQNLLARLAAARSRFVWQLVSLDEGELTDAPLFADSEQGWAVKDLLAHVAAWDELYAQRTALFGQGRTSEIEAVELEERNVMLFEERWDWSLEQTVRALTDARDDYLTALGAISDAGLHRRFRLPWGQRTTVAVWTRWRYRHDERHAADLLAWRAQTAPRPNVGPKAILQAALESGRQEMLTTAALVPPAERLTRPVCGVWTLKDLLGHLADWEWYGVEKLDGPPTRRALNMRFRGDIQGWNEAHAAARQDQPWDEVWADFQAARLALGQCLEKMSQEDLAQPFSVPWGRNWTVYRWLHLWLHHEREHAADLRANLDLSGWPTALRTFT